MEVGRMERLKHVAQLNILLGAWLIAAPFVLGYSRTPLEAANNIGVGVVVIACAWWLLAAASAPTLAAVVPILGGLWLIAVPFYFHYATPSRVYTNDLLLGVAVTVVSATAAFMLAERLRRPA
jgi:hypothetical protein